MMRRFLLALLLIASAAPAFAVNPDEMLKDPALESRARAISAELRCMVCQNQSIDDSNAELAKDLRLLVRKRITDGDSDQQVMSYIVSRYGEFVLLKPRFEVGTIALWLSPVLLFATGISLLATLFFRKDAPRAVNLLSPEERKRLNQLLDGPDC